MGMNVMNKVLGLTFAALLPSAAFADQPYFELDFGVSNDFRGGEALNSSGGGDELAEFSLVNLDGLAAFSLDSGLLFQAGLKLDRNFANAASSTIASTDDTYRLGSQFSLQIGQQLERHYFGAYAVVGRVSFNPDDDDQDANFQSYGVQGAWYGEGWSLSASLGRLDSSADNPETISNAFVVSAAGTHDLAQDTRLTGSITLMDGEQDIDSGSTPDPVKSLQVGFEIEHMVRETSYGSLAVYGGLSLINVWEDSSSLSTDHVNDTILSAGIRMQFGANSAGASDRRKSPPLPEMLRALGAVPAVD